MPTDHMKLGAAHLDAIGRARTGEAIAFMCADMVVSVEVFEASERRFAEGKKLIMAISPRTIGEPPIGASGQALMCWAMERAHPATQETFYGNGRSRQPANVYFSDGLGNISARGFHLHPFACIKEPKLKFEGKTVDYDLCAAFDESEIHVVTDADEMALAEVTPRDRKFKFLEPMTTDSIVEWAQRHNIPRHNWIFENFPIRVQGRPDLGKSRIICDEIMSKL